MADPYPTLFRQSLQNLLNPWPMLTLDYRLGADELGSAHHPD